MNHPNWFESWNSLNNIAAPSTNNDNESINRTIKDEDTLEMYWTCQHFCLLFARSSENGLISKYFPQNPNCKRFVKCPTIDLKT